MTEQWRVRQHIMPSGYLGDIYDGQIWRNVYSSFLTSPYSYLLCLNVDWFQPFKHAQYSVGAMYLTIQNLPRQECYKTLVTHGASVKIFAVLNCLGCTIEAIPQT